MAHSAGLEALCRVQGTATPEGAIQGACRQLMEGLNLTRPPIALKPIGDALWVNVDWKNAAARGVRGHASLVVSNGQLRVLVHRRGPSGWRHSRFLVAHELTHAMLIRLLRDGALIASLDATKKDLIELERLCDLGAYELLMPATSFRVSMANSPLSAATLRSLYDEYLVTMQAAAARVAFLSPRGSLIRLRRYARSSEEPVAWRVASCFPRYSTNSLRAWLPRGATLKHLSGLPDLDILSQSQESDHGKLEVSISSRRWYCSFTAFSLPNGRDRNVSRPLFEEFEVPDEPAPRAKEVLLFLRETEPISPREASTN